MQRDLSDGHDLKERSRGQQQGARSAVMMMQYQKAEVAGLLDDGGADDGGRAAACCSHSLCVTMGQESHWGKGGVEGRSHIPSTLQSSESSRT